MRTTPLLLLLAACGEAGSTKVPTVPAEGTWRYEDGGFVATTCGEEVYRDPDATFVIFDATDEGFTIETGDESFTCTLTGNTFFCADRLDASLTVPGTDTVLRWQIEVDGTLSSPTSITGTQTFDVDCTGSLCAFSQAALGFAVPCSYTVAFSASK